MEMNILIIDDSEEDVFLFKKALSSSGITATVTCNTDGITGLSTIHQQKVDCVFLDYYLPKMNGLEVLHRIRKHHPDIPVIILTGQRNEQTIVYLMQQGATDYLIKDALTPESLRLSIENSQRIYALKMEKLQAEEALRISEARLAEAQRIAHIGNWENDLVGNNFFLSAEARKIIEDYSPTPFKNFSKKVYQDDFALLRETIRNLKNGHSVDVTLRYYTSTHKTKYLHVKGHAVRINNRHHTVKKVVGTIQDITLLKSAILDTKKAAARNKVTNLALFTAILIFLLSETVLDPLSNSLTVTLLISIFVIALKPLDFFLGKIMMKRVAMK